LAPKDAVPMKRPLPSTPEEWFSEIKLAIADANETKPFGILTGQRIAGADSMTHFCAARIGSVFVWVGLAVLVGGCGDTSSSELSVQQKIRPLPPNLSPDLRQQAEGLYSPEPQTRAYAARRLGSGGRKSVWAMPLLLDALNDADRRVRSRAAEALGNIGGSDAVEPLIEALEKDGEDWEVRASVAEALGMLKDARATPSLVASLVDMVSHVRYQAAVALGEIGGGPDVVAALESTAQYDADLTVRDAARQSLQKIRRESI